VGSSKINKQFKIDDNYPEIVEIVRNIDCLKSYDFIPPAEDRYLITNFTPEDVLNNIRLALQYSLENKGTKGRNRILDLGLDSKSIAKKLIGIYKENIKS
jgi:hypothetical protein